MFSVCTLPPVDILAAVMLPLIDTAFDILSNVNAVLVLALPWSLNTTPVLAPGITMLPEILPTTLPMKFGAYTFPVKFAVLPDNSKLTVALEVVTFPAVIKLLPVMLPIAVINPPVPILPMLALPATVIKPVVEMFPAPILPTAVITPADPILPILALPMIDTLANAPTLVMLG